MSGSSVIVRAPLRLTLAGDWARFPQYYACFGGLTINASIDRYCYVVADAPSDRTIRIQSADYHEWEDCTHGVLVELGEHLQVAKAAVERFADRGLHQEGVSLFLASDVPPGAGLGASSATAVALIRALSTYLGIPMDMEEVAFLAGWIEVERLGTAVGKHDHYTSARGGINAISATGSGCTVSELAISADGRRSLSQRLLLFWSGPATSAAPFPTPPREHLVDEAIATRGLHNLGILAGEMYQALLEDDLDRVGMLLHTSWHYRIALGECEAGGDLDRAYEAARSAGAAGGRSMGRGGLLLYVEPEQQKEVRRAMSARGLREIPFNFEMEGAQILTSAERRLGAQQSGEPAARPVLVRERVTAASHESGLAKTRQMR